VKYPMPAAVRLMRGQNSVDHAYVDIAILVSIGTSSAWLVVEQNEW